MRFYIECAIVFFTITIFLLIDVSIFRMHLYGQLAILAFALYCLVMGFYAIHLANSEPE